MANPSVDDTHSYFAGLSHQQMLDMVRNSDPTTLSNRSGALSSASGTLSDISQQLQSNVRQLEWSGPAADSFRDWATKISTATQNLSDYAQASSTSLETASTALGTATKAIPPLPSKDLDTVNRYNLQPCVPIANEPQMKAQNPNFVTTEEMKAAQASITKDHDDAVTAMTTLVSAYTQSTSEIRSQTPPLFPPTPTAVMGPPPKGVWTASGVTFGGGGGVPPPVAVAAEVTGPPTGLARNALSSLPRPPCLRRSCARGRCRPCRSCTRLRCRSRTLPARPGPAPAQSGDAGLHPGRAAAQYRYRQCPAGCRPCRRRLAAPAGCRRRAVSAGVAT